MFLVVHDHQCSMFAKCIFIRFQIGNMFERIVVSTAQHERIVKRGKIRFNESQIHFDRNAPSQMELVMRIMISSFSGALGKRSNDDNGRGKKIRILHHCNDAVYHKSMHKIINSACSFHCLLNLVFALNALCVVL